MDAREIIDYIRRRPYIAVGAALVSIVPVAMVWHGGRSNAPAASATGIIGDSVTGRIVVPDNTSPGNATTTTPAPLPPPSNIVGGFVAATLPKGYKCGNGGRPVFAPKPGSFVQNTGEVVCLFADRRTQSPIRI